jgi:peptidoglycan/LPS O-acetylase OafA/YrhL
MPSPLPPKARIDTWTGLRAIAALWVVLFHLDCYNLHLDYGWLKPLVGRGELGVDLFFILSGIVISHVHLAEFKQYDWPLTARFLILRFARIYPLHLVMLLFVAAQQGIESVYSWQVWRQAPLHDLNGWPNFFLSLLNIHGWETTQKLSFNFPSWSVSAEWFAYLCFPLLAPWLQRIRSIRMNLLLIAGCLFLLYWVCLLNHTNDLGFTTHLGLLRIGTEFIAGVGIYSILKLQRNSIPGANGLGLLSLVLIPVLILWDVHEIWLVADFCLLLYTFSQFNGWLKAAFANRTMVFGGKISYAIYMVHAFILHLINDACLFFFHWRQWDFLHTIALSLFTLMLVIMAAIPLHRYIEVPARTTIRAMWEQCRSRITQPVVG